MVKSLLDTCVISELQQSVPATAVVHVLNNLDENQTFVSAISIGELRYGMEPLPEGHRQMAIKRWIESLEYQYQKRISPVDAEVAKLFGNVMARTKKAGFVIQVTDGLIAATAMHYGLHVVTRNVRRFEPTGALIINPWDE